MDYNTLSRLKLQSLCVKNGLNASGKNEDLIQRLQAHSSQSSNDNTRTQDDTKATTSTAVSIGNSRSRRAGSRAGVTVEIVTQLEVSVKEEQHDDHGVQHGDRPQGLEVATPIKQEEGAPTALVREPLVSPQVKQEATHPGEVENPFLVKSEEQELTVKRESMEPEIKEEEEIQSRRALQAFWESRSKAGQMSSTHTIRDTQPPSKVIGKRARSDTVGDSDGRDERSHSIDSGDASTVGSRSLSPSDPLPRSGTVRKLIGRFATGSSTTPEPVGSPSASKRQRIEPHRAPPSSPSATRVARFGSAASSTFSSASSTPATSGAGGVTASPKPKVSRREAAAEAARKVIRVPTVKKESAQESSASTLATTPPPPTTPRKGATTPKRRAPSTEDHPGLETPTKRTYTGTGRGPTAETINRLATPKNKSLSTKRAAVSSSSTSAPTNVPGPSTLTRPRAPILSTASRAAQRARRGN
ncbi:hypothetical protein DFQ27_003206 [Actinomortierella ambigua]|uniref:SAP domain-containing protein n=1 Tax=Actinomortierella ambigua TaxID=1343610 RepID=A0A9P6UCM8_9FUNG|nr:hypothetical protein DFQ27_003206 [Actinomortierella ambigua]